MPADEPSAGRASEPDRPRTDGGRSGTPLESLAGSPDASADSDGTAGAAGGASEPGAGRASGPGTGSPGGPAAGAAPGPGTGSTSGLAAGATAGPGTGSAGAPAHGPSGPGVDRLFEEVAFVAYHFGWSHDAVLELPHWERRRWCAEISRINERMNGGERG